MQGIVVLLPILAYYGFQVGGGWQPYDPETSDFIEEASRSRSAQGVRVQIGSSVFFIDLINKQQISEASGIPTSCIQH